MFNEYWKVKAAKRRKAWAAVAKRFANEHAQIKRIRERPARLPRIYPLVEAPPHPHAPQPSFRFRPNGQSV